MTCIAKYKDFVFLSDDIIHHIKHNLSIQRIYKSKKKNLTIRFNIKKFIPLSSTSNAPVCTKLDSTEFPRKNAAKHAKTYKKRMSCHEMSSSDIIYCNECRKPTDLKKHSPKEFIFLLKKKKSDNRKIKIP